MAENAEFQQAATDVKNLKASPDQDEKLNLYALFKVGNGEDIKAAKAPGMFEMAEKYKRKAWQAEVDKGTTPEEAQKKYIQLVNELKEKYGF